MKATIEVIFEKAKEWGYTETQQKKKNSIRTLLTYLVDDGLIRKTNQKVGREFFYEFESWGAIQNWIEKNKVPEDYVSLKEADKWGLTYPTARNRCLSRNIKMDTYGFGLRRMIYIKRSEMDEITRKVIS